MVTLSLKQMYVGKLPGWFRWPCKNSSSVTLRSLYLSSQGNRPRASSKFSCNTASSAPCQPYLCIMKWELQSYLLTELTFQIFKHHNMWASTYFDVHSILTNPRGMSVSKYASCLKPTYSEQCARGSNLCFKNSSSLKSSSCNRRFTYLPEEAYEHIRPVNFFEADLYRLRRIGKFRSDSPPHVNGNKLKTTGIAERFYLWPVSSG